jgi:hypothetical protein
MFLLLQAAEVVVLGELMQDKMVAVEGLVVDLILELEFQHQI